MTAPIHPPVADEAALKPTHPIEEAELEAKAAVLVEIEARLQALDDGLDHPDCWHWLSEMGAGDTGAFLIEQLRAGWGNLGFADARIRNLALCLLIAGSGNTALTLEALRQIEAQGDALTQVNGAQFFVSRLGDANKSADLSQRFCAAPFTKFETLVDGKAAPCCSIWTDKRLGHLERQTADEIWNSRDAQEMRASILDGSFRYCNKQRCTLITDDTLPLRDEVEDPTLRRIIDEEMTELDTSPSWLFLAHDITCNLACPSCRDGMIVSNEEQERRFEKIERQVFFPLLGSGDAITVSVSGQGGEQVEGEAIYELTLKNQWAWFISDGVSRWDLLPNTLGELTSVDPGARALAATLVPIAEELARRLDRHGLAGRTVTLKVKSAAFQIAQRSATLTTPVATESELMTVGLALLHRPAPPTGPQRLIGLTVSGLVPSDGGRQLAFPFALPEPWREAGADAPSS